MLYRPMLPDNRDVLFSGAVTTGGKPEEDLKLQGEVEHLTCFIGGMIGMGAKIFNIEGDLELAKKLAYGCVWAYESTPSGIMPEGATLMPCESAEHCTWNETAYFHFLDPMADERETLLEQYDANKLTMAAEAEAQAKLVAEDQQKAASAKAEADAGTAAVAEETEDNVNLEHIDKVSLHDQETSKSTEREPKSANDPASLQKRQSSTNDDLPLPIIHNSKDDNVKAKSEPQKDSGETKGVSNASGASVEKVYQQKALSTESELRNIATGRQAEIPLSDAVATPTLKDEALVDPLRPLSHKEFVNTRIKEAALPPGFVGIRGRKYILRQVLPFPLSLILIMIIDQKQLSPCGICTVSLVIRRGKTEGGRCLNRSSMQHRRSMAIQPSTTSQYQEMRLIN